MPRSPRWAAVVGVAAVLGVTGCTDGVTMRPTMTLTQATGRVKQIVQEAFTQLPAGAELKDKGSPDPVPCEGAGGMNSGQVFVELDYELVHPGTWPTDQIIEILDRYWKSRGYALVRDSRDQRLPAALVMRDNSDKTQIGVRVYYGTDGQITAYLIGSSPCIWENGSSPASDS